MRFRKNAKLDASQVSDRRGMRPGGMAAGAGGIGAIVVLVIALLGGGGGGGGGGGLFEALEGLTVDQGGGVPNDLSDECRTGADANERDDCRIVAVVNSVQAYWSEFDGYQPAPTVFFSGSVATACGNATSAVGPFYCPADSTIYIDLGFYDDLRERFGASGGPFAEAYVIAHEYGHHIQNLSGVLESTRDGRTGPDSNAVRVELQADCYGGAWAAGAERTGFIEPLTEANIADGLDAAGSIGDDRIQETLGGEVQPHTFSHGTSAQRQRWFLAGYQSDDPAVCDTFATDDL